MNYAIFPSMLKKRLKLGANRTLYNAPEAQFEALASYIQTRIRGTKLARMRPRQDIIRHSANIRSRLRRSMTEEKRAR
jgi:hypothetical protein